MGLRLIIDREAKSDAVAMYDSTSGWAFGPVFDTEDEAEEFIAFVGENGYADLRSLDEGVLDALHGQFLRRQGDS